MNYDIKDENQRFTLIKGEEEIGYLKYVKDIDGDFIIESIFIKEDYRGGGYAKIIFDRFIEKAQKEKSKIIPICSYAKVQFEKRKEIQDILKNR